MTEAAEPRRKWTWWLDGRAGRAEYWVSVAFIFALGIALSFVPALSGTSTGLTAVLMFVQIRRVHDFDRSGWWAVLATFAPVVVMLPLMGASLDVAILVGLLAELAAIVVVGVIPGTPGDNRFGPQAAFTWKRTLTGR